MLLTQFSVSQTDNCTVGVQALSVRSLTSIMFQGGMHFYFNFTPFVIGRPLLELHGSICRVIVVVSSAFL